MINIRDDKFLKELGNHIRNLRKLKGFSQEKFAYHCELEITQIGRIERGEVNVTVCTLKVIANGLDVPIDDLFLFEY